VEVVPPAHPPFLVLDDGDALAAQDEEAFLRGFGVVVAVRLAGPEYVDVDADARRRRIGVRGVEPAPDAEPRDRDRSALPRFRGVSIPSLLRVGSRRTGRMAVDLVIDVENTPGALAEVAAAISDAGVNISAATCIGTGERAELHILVPHAEAARHSLAISHVAVSREREVVVVDVEDRPGVLADLTRRIAAAGVNLDLVYVATRNRVVFGAVDIAALQAVLDGAG